MAERREYKLEEGKVKEGALAEPGRGLSRVVAVSCLYSGLGQGLSRLIALLALFVVLKIISAAELGLVTSVMAIVTILQSLTELGLGIALVQRQQITREQTSSLFWLSSILSILFYGLIFLGAPLVGWFYDEPRLVPLLRVHALCVVLSSFYLVPRNLLVKELKLGRIAVIENVSLTLSSGVMIAGALLGHGPWCIVAGEVSNRFMQLILSFVLRPYRPQLRLDVAEIYGMVKLGLYATGSRLLYNFYINADYLVVSKVFGWETVGVYTVAYRVVSDPVRTMAAIMNLVAYPTFAKVQKDIVRLRRYLYTMARANLAFVGATLIIVVVYADWLLLFAGYDQYMAADPLLHVFSVVAEAGPLVFLEALAAGCFPLGTYMAGMAASIDSVAPSLPEGDSELMKLSARPAQTVLDIVDRAPRALALAGRHRDVLRQVAVDRYEWRSVARKLAAVLAGL